MIVHDGIPSRQSARFAAVFGPLNRFPVAYPDTMLTFRDPNTQYRSRDDQPRTEFARLEADVPRALAHPPLRGPGPAARSRGRGARVSTLIDWPGSRGCRGVRASVARRHALHQS